MQPEHAVHVGLRPPLAAVNARKRYVFSSDDHDGVGQLRRNSLIAAAVLAQDPTARVVLVTGVGQRPRWLGDDNRVVVVRVPPLLTSPSGEYVGGQRSFDEAIAERAQIFDDLVRTAPADVVVVDRHPYGIAGELRPGLERARENGAVLVLGLRDVLDKPGVVAREIEGKRWRGVPDLYHCALVYGGANLVDHEREYGLPIEPEYCGWVVGPIPPTGRQPHRLVITAGGGGDGAQVFKLGRRLIELDPCWHGVIAAGPYARWADGSEPRNGLRGRLTVLESPGGCGRLFAGAEAVLCRAGYNSTVEALGAGRRPILVPRRKPRGEQAIRADRLAAFGLAHVVEEGAAPREVAWLLRRDNTLTPEQVERSGLRLDGAERAARRIVELAHAGRRGTDDDSRPVPAVERPVTAREPVGASV
jgi:predicted glycosyltransferase